MHHSLRRVIALVAAALFLTTTGWATSLVKLSLLQLTERAQLITHGQCVKLEHRWVGKNLLTIATIEVVETLKGDAPAVLQLVLPGGIDTDRDFPVAVTYPGAPSIWDAEEVFLYLEPFEGLAGSYWPVGFSQGKLSVMRDADGTAMVTLGRSSNHAAFPLRQLKEEIRAHLDTLR